MKIIVSPPDYEDYSESPDYEDYRESPRLRIGMIHYETLNDSGHNRTFYLQKPAVGFLLLLIVVTSAQEDAEDGQKGKFFIKSYSTTTWTFLSSFVSTVPYTCYKTAAVAANTKACSGRRLLRARRSNVNEGTDSTELLSSIRNDNADLLANIAEDGLAASDSDSEREKFFFTVWRTSSSTATITTYSTNRSVTVSASVMCTYPGVTLNLC
ncbi:uncharacterized protein [Cherax quadricarinatus]|uniref:uncharacterized protein n=1 Tax=Cherax quadricarinatus TaxID=27406 RepID=UPI00237878F1|nr:uncharacterized protein LOC128702250 [Cherax quadricarinatus]